MPETSGARREMGLCALCVGPQTARLLARLRSMASCTAFCGQLSLLQRLRPAVVLWVEAKELRGSQRKGNAALQAAMQKQILRVRLEERAIGAVARYHIVLFTHEHRD